MPQRHVNGGITHELNRKDASKKISGQFFMKLKLLWLNIMMIYDVDVVSLTHCCFEILKEDIM